jgi:hypothetical protein
MSTQAHDDRGRGWLQFTAVMLFAVGFFRIISAIGYSPTATRSTT